MGYMDKQAKYRKLHDQLLRRFEPFLPGTRLDSVRSLQKEYRVSLATLNTALKMLVEEGVIESVRNKGLYRTAPGCGNASRTVVLVLPGQDEPLFRKIIFACYEALEKLNMRMQLAIYGLSAEQETEVVRGVLEDEPDGVLYMPTLVSGALKRLLLEWSRTVPVMQINREVGEPSLSFVGNECFESSREATATLIRHGHRRIGVIYANDFRTCQDQQERIAGFKAALDEAGLPYEPQYDIIYDGFDCRISTDVVALLLSPRRPTAFFATNSAFLSNLIQKAAFCKLSIPDDLSVTSFDLGETFASLPLQFDRMEQAMVPLCARAVELLDEMMRTRDFEPRRERIPGRPVPGDSCRDWREE